MVYRAQAAPGVLFDGYRFQLWPSNWTMQTMGLEEMLPFGPKSLWFEHVYPPGLDSVRYLLMLPETNQGLPPDATAVDLRLYAIYCLVFGALNATVFLWVRDLTRSIPWSLAGTVLWAMYPGYLMVTMLLEGSAPSLLFVSVSYFYLYRFLKTRRVIYVSGFLFMFLLESWMRSIAQIHVLFMIVVMFFVFWWMARDRTWWRQVINVLLVLMIFALPIKQQIMYGTLSSSTYAGYHRVGMLWIDPRTVPEIEYPQNALSNAEAFYSRYNIPPTLKDDLRLEAAANDFLIHHPIDAAKGAMKSLQITIPDMLGATSTYTQNLIVDVLPWTTAFNFLFSGWRYVLLVLLAAAIIVWSRGWRGTRTLFRRYGWFLVYYALIGTPVLLSNRYRIGEEDAGPTWDDAVRLKIFIEVPIYVLITYAAWTLTSRLKLRWKASKAPELAA
jgi:hypothetical protein